MIYPYKIESKEDLVKLCELACKEDFPICGMDECTFDYLLADLALKLGKYDIADKYASAVIVARTANTKLKERARSLRDIIKKNKSDENGKN